MDVLTVLVVDDQQLLRRGLAMLLSTVEGIEIGASAVDGAEALAVLRRGGIDVVVTDARMPGMDGVELVARCAAEHPGLPVLLLTTFDEDALVQSALAAGAAGFLLKDTSTDALAAAIRTAAQGGRVVDPRVARAAVGERASAPQDDPLGVLTRTERLVAEQVAQGRTNTEIAEELVLAEGTVKNHVSALLRKLGARDRTALALQLYKILHR
ncbi:response regulator transcription factor [Brachybacterium hainanense]|uniref:Response regulator transcription factor n=1 Tax=Brachybacterium hainanense TaxID=1541174 RepID=A0ABV6R9P6_9MICO